ncbi:MAG: cellulase family glycosylhydrolase [Clostridia bacterium]|nr:cellulase family glycosylhydrolase [Clostridia bacterium]
MKTYYRETGKVKTVRSDEVKTSRLGIGLEKLDRDLFDPTDVYDELRNLGVKWIRLQSGWCRTETEKGKYDFSWLDDIIDNLVSRGLVPWVCLCYGNDLYTEGANDRYGSVGYPPIKTEEERTAWENYVKKCVKRYIGRVSYYEIWNEPDGQHCWRHGVNAKEYAEFAHRTAAAIKSVDPQAKVIVGSFYTGLEYLYDFLSAGDNSLYDYVTYHRYKYIPDNGTIKYVEGANAVIKQFSDNIKLIQGETGTHSENSPNGALPGANWTERKQAKFLLRKIVIDLTTDVFFTSYFTAVDMFENIITDGGEKVRSMYGFFGVLGEEFDGETPLGKYREKPSYHAYKNVAGIFSEDVKCVSLPVQFENSFSHFVGKEDDRGQDDFGGVYSFGFEKPNGSKALAYWKGSEILTTEYESTVSFKAFGLSDKVKLVDLYDGKVYEIGDEILKKLGNKLIFEHLILKDYPMLVTFGDFFDEE